MNSSEQTQGGGTLAGGATFDVLILALEVQVMTIGGGRESCLMVNYA